MLVKRKIQRKTNPSRSDYWMVSVPMKILHEMGWLDDENSRTINELIFETDKKSGVILLRPVFTNNAIQTENGGGESIATTIVPITATAPKTPTINTPPPTPASSDNADDATIEPSPVVDQPSSLPDNQHTLLTNNNNNQNCNNTSCTPELPPVLTTQQQQEPEKPNINTTNVEPQQNTLPTTNTGSELPTTIVDSQSSLPDTKIIEKLPPKINDNQENNNFPGGNNFDDNNNNNFANKFTNNEKNNNLENATTTDDPNCDDDDDNKNENDFQTNNNNPQGGVIIKSNNPNVRIIRYGD